MACGGPRAVAVTIAVVGLVACRRTQPPHSGKRDATAEPSSGLTLVRQVSAADCGPAALTMTFNRYGRSIALDQVTREIGGAANGTSAADIVREAERHGLGTSGVSVDPELARSVLEPGDILHWNFNHFVVFERSADTGVWVLDPGAGEQLVDTATFAKAFTGVALLFANSPDAMLLRKAKLGLR